MKNAVAGLLGILLLAMLTFSGDNTFSLLISGGMTRIFPDDLNSFLRDYARSYRYSAGGTKVTFQGEDAKILEWSAEFELTLLVRAAPRIFLTLGFGFIQAGLESEPLVLSYSGLEKTLSRNDSIRSVPIKVGLLYSWPLSRRLNLHPHISLDGYISYFRDKGVETIKDLEEGYIFGDSGYIWEVKTHTFNWGATAGLSVDVALSRAVSLSLDAGYRRARLTGFHGPDDQVASGKFRLLYYEEVYLDWTRGVYRFLNLPVNNAPTSLDTVRDAVLDLSGPYLKAGLRLSL